MKTALSRFRHLASGAAALALLAAPWPARAQDASFQDAPFQDAPQAGTPKHVSDEFPDDIPHVIVTPAPRPLSNDELARALAYDTATLAESGSRKRVHVPLKSAPRASWNGGRRDDGSTHVSVTRPIAPDWNVRAGADLTVPAEPATTYRPGGPLPGTTPGDAQGGVWAAAAVPHVADVQVRVDPGLTQSRLGADLKRTVPLGEDYSVTLQNKVAVTETTGLVPAPDGATLRAGSQIWDTERSVRFNMRKTGTTIGAGATTSTVDGVTHHSFSADQRIYGPLHITGSVTDPGRETFSQSIGARLKLTW